MNDSQSPPDSPEEANPCPEPKEPETRVYRPMSRRDLFERAGSLLIGAFGAGVFLPLAGIDSLDSENGLDPNVVRDKLRSGLSDQEAEKVEEALDGAAARSSAADGHECACSCTCQCACECGCNCQCDGFPCECLCDCGCSCDCGCGCACWCYCVCNCDDDGVTSASIASTTGGTAHIDLDARNYNGAIAGTHDTTFEADWNANGGASSVASVNNNMAVAPDAPTATASTSTASQESETSVESTYFATDYQSTVDNLAPTFLQTVKPNRGHIWSNLRL